MLFALGAASSVLDALQSLATTKSSSSQSATSSQGATSPFDFLGTSGTTTGPASAPCAPGRSRISPETMNALIAAQSQSGATNTAPLLQALNAQTAPASLTGSTSAYDLFDQLMQRQTQNSSSATSAALSV
jgi:hypothetical protein